MNLIGNEAQFAQQNLMIDDPARRGNPLEYAVVKHHRFLLGCLTPALAYCQQNYPFSGFARCLQRQWAEVCQQGSKKHEWRVVKQTTKRKWNVKYTQDLQKLQALTDPAEREQASQQFNQWLRSEWDTIRHTPENWNAPKASTYHFFAVWEELYCWQQSSPSGQLDPSQVTPALRPFMLHYSSPAADFMYLVQQPIQVTPEQWAGISLAARTAQFPLETIQSRISVLTA
jgi:hypothetical protein